MIDFYVTWFTFLFALYRDKEAKLWSEHYNMKERLHFYLKIFTTITIQEDIHGP